jgi:hypothetical protein
MQENQYRLGLGNPSKGYALYKTTGSTMDGYEYVDRPSYRSMNQGVTWSGTLVLP